MRFMFAYPQYGSEGDMLAAGAVSELAKTAEASGWHGMAFTDHPAPGAKWQQVRVEEVSRYVFTFKHLSAGKFTNCCCCSCDLRCTGRVGVGVASGFACSDVPYAVRPWEPSTVRVNYPLLTSLSVRQKPQHTTPCVDVRACRAQLLATSVASRRSPVFCGLHLCPGI